MLTDVRIRALEPRKQPYKTFDGGGRWWRLKYRYAGREKLLSLGTYPNTSLKLARSKRDDARSLLAQDIDPGARRREEKAARDNTLDNIGDEWIKEGCPGGKNKLLKIVTIDQLRQRFDKYLKPALGKMPIADIAVADLRGILLKIQGDGHADPGY